MLSDINRWVHLKPSFSGFLDQSDVITLKPYSIWPKGTGALEHLPLWMGYVLNVPQHTLSSQTSSFFTLSLTACLLWGINLSSGHYLSDVCKTWILSNLQFTLKTELCLSLLKSQVFIIEFFATENWPISGCWASCCSRDPTSVGVQWGRAD